MKNKHKVLLAFLILISALTVRIFIFGGPSELKSDMLYILGLSEEERVEIKYDIDTLYSIYPVEGSKIQNKSLNLYPGEVVIERESIVREFTDSELTSEELEKSSGSLKVGENVLMKSTYLRNSNEKFFYLKSEQKKKQFLDKNLPFKGYYAYLSNINVDEQNLSSEELISERIILDYNYSQDSDVVGLLEAEVVKSIKEPNYVCSNCANIYFDIYYTNYSTLDGLKITEVKLREATILVDDYYGQDLTERKSINTLGSNLNTVDYSREVYKDLIGNELIRFKLYVSDNGEDFIVEEDDGFYSLINNKYRKIKDFEELAEKFGNGKSVDYSVSWLPGNRTVIQSRTSSDTKFLNLIYLKDGSENVLKSPKKLISAWSVSESELLSAIGKGSQIELASLDRYLSFEERETLFELDNKDVRVNALRYLEEDSKVLIKTNQSLVEYVIDDSSYREFNYSSPEE